MDSRWLVGAYSKRRRLVRVMIVLSRVVTVVELWLNMLVITRIVIWIRVVMWT